MGGGGPAIPNRLPGIGRMGRWRTPRAPADPREGAPDTRRALAPLPGRQPRMWPSAAAAMRPANTSELTPVPEERYVIAAATRIPPRHTISPAS